MPSIEDSLFWQQLVRAAQASGLWARDYLSGEDMVQAVALRLLAGGPEEDIAARLERSLAYWRTAVRNEVKSFIRKEGKHPRPDRLEAYQHLQAPPSGGGRLPEWVEWPEAQWLLEYSERTNSSPGADRVKAHRLRKKLREALAGARPG